MHRPFLLLALMVALAAGSSWAHGPSGEEDDHAGEETAQPRRPGEPPLVVVLNFKGAVSPATSDYFHRGLEGAVEQGAGLVVLRMDTPGGLDTAMRDIIRDIISSPIPVATFVAPSGARAASAGTYILYASHIAAMAPGTNVGAATPVQIGGPPAPPDKEPPGDGDSDKEGDKAKEPEAAPREAHPTMSDKMLSDAAAYIRSLAQMRGRNAEWAEKAVREAASLSADDALQAYVIDLMADDVHDLLDKLDGRTVTVLGGDFLVETAGARIVEIEPDWRSELLALITNPNVAYILLMLGFYGLLFEFWNPGAIVPGVVGAISLLLALYALQALPVNYAGLALILLGIAFMVTEAFVPSFGMLGIGGLVAFVFGSVMLIDAEVPGYGIAWPVIIAVSATSAAFFMFVIGMAVTAHRRRVVSGREELIGSYGQVVDWTGSSGRVRMRGEVWRATATAPLEAGSRVRVAGMEGLTLILEPADENRED